MTSGLSGSVMAPQLEPALEEAYLFRLPKSYFHADYVWPGVLMSKEQIDALKHFHFRPTDILIVSYPKSGTTWVSEIVSLICHGGDVERVKSRRLHDRVPWLELDNSNFWVRFFWLCQTIARKLGLASVLPPGSVDEVQEEEVEGEAARVFFTHMPLELLPTNALEGRCKIIYVARNPKDNAVSFFHFHKMSRFLGLQETSWEEFFPLYTVGKIYCGSWFEHVLGFWRFNKLNPRMVFLKYEDMKKDLRGEVSRLCDFLEIPLDAAAIDRVVSHCDFSQMKDNKMANRDGVWAFNQSISKFMRKGVVGDWKNYFTVAQSDLFDAVYETRMTSEPNLSFQFEPDDDDCVAGDGAAASLPLVTDITDGLTPTTDVCRQRDGSTPEPMHF